ncbi:LOW QUALITY PROTEIN: DNA/RNA-binding protein KIN17 [Nylanderia fulva]|uniref:LOW QUALITY PROTEIN: DNA/RNA-binding protein KIN17 n=1 Tax=Nylanderia fulva TaxID=613905 RepID=UPI0010FB66D9|nr:LOW QUALITY PROTEIN: DNA/RNA-binding protein KIN17 [Nylanderia fulva]
MGKHEVGTPKYIANKIKAKGLQKLRWYCQMCQKQCRDENGFKCHTMSESHHRQLLLFAENAHRYMDQFSREFSQGYLNLLKRQFGTRRVPANRVYQEYISDRGHIHMNATQWLTLTAFVKWLGRSGQCVVDETEKGWFVTYIDRDPETLAAQEKKAKKEKMDKDDEERLMDFIEKQIERNAKQDAPEEESETFKTPLMRSENDAPLVLDIKLKPKPKLLPVLNIKQEKKSENSIQDQPVSSKSLDEREKSKRSIYDETKSVKKLKSDNNPEIEGWLKEGLMVKVTTKSLDDKYYKSKGVVQSVEKDGFVAKVKLKTPDEVEGHIIRLDQEYLETVIPAIGKEVLILWGKYKGKIAIVKKLHIEHYSIDVELKKDKKVVEKLPYEQVCKYVD